MKKDFRVFASLLSATPDDIEQLASWLAERESRKEAMEMKVDATVQDNSRLSAEFGRYDDSIAISQIRILSKQYTSDPDVIPYVAVIDKWDDDMWLIIPFSPYKTPATESEMATEMDINGLRVLQAWNGRTVQDSVLKKSFLAGVINSEVRDDALALFRHEFGGVQLPDGFSSHRGSPIVEETDPRRDYLNECIERFQPLADAVLEMVENRVVEKSGILDILIEKYKLEESTYALAAATKNNETLVPILMHKDAWDVMLECNEVSGFSGFYSGDPIRTLIFDLDKQLPEEFKGQSVIRINAYKLKTRELVGKGELRQEDTGYRLCVRLGEDCEDLEVKNVGELVLIAE